MDLDAGTVSIARQLDAGGKTPKFGPTKTGKARTISLWVDTVDRLRAHRKNQRLLVMANRTTYRNHDLVFAKEPEHLYIAAAALGDPITTLAGRWFHRLGKAAGLRRIKFHGLRHTSATLLLQEGVPPQVVAERLGHAQISMTLQVYSHALPHMHRDAAARLGALLTRSAPAAS